LSEKYLPHLPICLLVQTKPRVVWFYFFSLSRIFLTKPYALSSSHIPQAITVNELFSKFEEAAESVLILDKKAFAKISGKFGKEVVLLGESLNFFCIAKKTMAPELEARKL
jgi:hypothetical protein